MFLISLYNDFPCGKNFKNRLKKLMSVQSANYELWKLQVIESLLIHFSQSINKINTKTGGAFIYFALTNFITINKSDLLIVIHRLLFMIYYGNTHSATGNLTPKTDGKWWPLLPLLKRHSWSKRKWPFKRTRFYRWQNLTLYSCWIRDFVEKSSGGGFSAYLSHRRRFSNQNAIIADCRAGNFRFILIYNLFREEDHSDKAINHRPPSRDFFIAK